MPIAANTICFASIWRAIRSRDPRDSQNHKPVNANAARLIEPLRTAC